MSWLEYATVTTVDDKVAATAQELLENEKQWVASEMKNADIELNKHEDGHTRLKGGSAQKWRAYRNELRDYIQAGVAVTDKPVRPA